MTVYIDISQLERSRANTGIQRVVKEFLQRAINDDTKATYKILAYNKKIKKMQVLPIQEVKLFCEDITNYKFKKRQTINIETIKPKETTIFFDIDSAWNAPYKRDKLYPIIKKNGFFIFNFIHDLIPILLPKYVQEVTINNYKPFIKTVYAYSDMVLFNSTSSKNDFLEYQKELKLKKNIPTKVVGLGSDFLSSNSIVKDAKIKAVLDKKYLLFVGTLEPRKNHKEVLDAFDILSKKYPDLNLVFIGIKGWKIDDFIERIESHPLKDDRLFWFNKIDDDTLYHFYQNAFIVTYLSKYEGFGLPIVESLQHGKITITSKNSSMPEVGLDYADYIEDGNLEQLVETISLYLNSNDIYDKKIKRIKSFTPLSWDKFSNLIFENNYNFHKRKEKESRSFKDSIKRLPVVGWAARWVYNLLRLNNLKHILFHQQKLIKQQKLELSKQQKEIKQLKSYIDKKIDDDINKKLKQEVAKQISFHSDAFTQRLDQFILDTKIQSKKETT
ncbi:MAG: glycosyltransferase family 1 protein [Campylobacterota bacterium]|nr:glycosyltransferase family 1 protein [Campylobacterota bacterium]